MTNKQKAKKIIQEAWDNCDKNKRSPNIIEHESCYSFLKWSKYGDRSPVIVHFKNKDGEK